MGPERRSLSAEQAAKPGIEWNWSRIGTGKASPFRGVGMIVNDLDRGANCGPGRAPPAALRKGYAFPKGGCHQVVFLAAPPPEGRRSRGLGEVEGSSARKGGAFPPSKRRSRGSSGIGVGLGPERRSLSAKQAAKPGIKWNWSRTGTGKAEPFRKAGGRAAE